MTVLSTHAPSERCERPLVHSRFRRPLAVLVAVGGVSLLGTGAFASWQATGAATSAALNASAGGTITAVDASTGKLNVPVTNLLPGDWLYRYVDITNSGTTNSTVVQTLATTGGLGPALVGTVETCPTAWNTTGGTCSATPTTLGAGTLTSTLALGSPKVFAPASIQHVRIKLELPSAADASYMGKTTTVSISSTGDLVGNSDRTNG